MNKPMEPTKTLFTETQKFTQSPFLAVILLIPATVWYGTFTQIILKKPFGIHPAPDSMMVVFWIVFGILFPVFFLITKLITEVRADGVYYRFFPIHRSTHKILLEEVSRYDLVRYRPFKEYRGWGIRYGKTGKAYTIRGN